MDIDIKAGTITFRVLYVGPEGACKLMNIQGLRRGIPSRGGAQISMLHTEEDRIASFPFQPEDVQPVMGLQVQFRAMAVPGRVRSRATHRLLLLAADGIVFLPDRSHPAGRQTKRAFHHLLDELASVGRDPKSLTFVIQDYTDGEPRLELDHLGPRARAVDPVLVPVEGDTPQAVSAVFEVACARVLSRFRELEDELGVEQGREVLAEQIAARTSPLEPPPSRRPMSRESLITILLLAAAGLAALLVSLFI